jgi:anthranilate phosphoribosyltransferase
MGVFAPDLTDLLANVLGELGARSAMVVSGYGGVDELTVTGPNTISHYHDGHTDNYTLDPLDMGFDGANINQLRGGDVQTNAAILRGVLNGEIADARRDVVVLNAGAALMAAGKAESIQQGIKLAGETIDSGAALKKLDALIECSGSFSAGDQG